MCEMQFQPNSKTESTLTQVLANSISIIEKINNAAIIFDDQKNCLFCNPTAEEIVGSRFNIFVLENWIRSLEADFWQKSRYFQVQELPFLTDSICNQSITKLEISVNQVTIADGAQVQSFSLLSLKQVDSSSQTKVLVEKRKSNNFIVCKDANSEFDLGEGHSGTRMHVGSLNALSECISRADRLTGLPNHNVFLDYISQAVSLAQQYENYGFAILSLDIDRFKVINSSLGRVLGDRLLAAIALRIKNCLRTHDFISRLGSDEFGILLNNIQHLDYVTTVAERIYKEFIPPFNLDGYEIFVEATIGIAIGNKDYNRPEDLLRDAELAVSDAKRNSRLHYQVFNKSMRGRAIGFLQLENDLRRAIKLQEFFLHYQPIVSLADNKIRGFEVLVRWQHPVKGLVPPGEFIPLAEETGLIVPLGSWVLREACWQMRIWQLQFEQIADWKTSVNISSKQLAQPHFVAQVKQILQETQLHPRNLKLEITESSLIEDTESTLSILRELKAIGIEFSLDDFGTGYSSLSYLHQFPFDTIKIDRSFVSSLEDNSEKLGIVRAIITLALNLGMNTIAEGIETVNQLTQLKALKCQYGQGYFLSKPLDKKVLESKIATEIAKPDEDYIDNYHQILAEDIAQENLLWQIEQLRQEVEELKREKVDLEIMLETNTEHADAVESQLHQEICNHQKAQAALHLANQELEKLSILDGLTQVANRRCFDDYLLQEWQKANRQQVPISLILADIDYFKFYNDTYGHPIGDYCLQQVALTIECVIESLGGLVARYGGEEFAIILPGIDGQKALEIAEDIGKKVRGLKIDHQMSPINNYVTLSLGVYSVVPSKESSPELLIALADKALYQSKNAGRNQANLFV